MSSNDVRDAAHCIGEDSGSNKLVRKIVKAGKRGDIRGNVHRDVLRGMLNSSSQPMYYNTTISLWDTDRGEKVDDTISYLIPYEVLDHAIDKKNGDFSEFCSLPDNSPWR